MKIEKQVVLNGSYGIVDDLRGQRPNVIAVWHVIGDNGLRVGTYRTRDEARRSTGRIDDMKLDEEIRITIEALAIATMMAPNPSIALLREKLWRLEKEKAKHDKTRLHPGIGVGDVRL